MQSRGPSPAGVLGDICGCFGAARKGQHRPSGAVLSQAAGNTDPARAIAGFPDCLLASCSALIAGRASSTAGQLLRRARASWARLIVAACPCCQDLHVPWSTALSTGAGSPHHIQQHDSPKEESIGWRAPDYIRGTPGLAWKLSMALLPAPECVVTHNPRQESGSCSTVTANRMCA